MARLFYLHWHKDECLAAVGVLRAAGHSVRYHHESGADAWKLLEQAPPEVLVVSLDRLPSHGRRVAAVTKENKKLGDLPIIFVGGLPDKVATAQKEFRQARCCSFEELAKTIAGLDPATPAEITPDNRQTQMDWR